MNTAVITGSAGLVGSEAAGFFLSQGFKVIGIDNDLRMYFFGPEASTRPNRERLQRNYPEAYIHKTIDIRSLGDVEPVFREFNQDIRLVIHTAAQPSHDWAAQEPFTDFSVNANGTLNLLEMTRQHCPRAVFIFTSTNKVYGDRPNTLPFIETETRWELPEAHPYFNGIDENMSIDYSKHSLFGASKVAADILVQEYGRYFGLQTACFRGGCLTGPNHTGTREHGFLSYLMKCCISGAEYTIFGYKGKQVRDSIHSRDLISAFDHFYRNPRVAEVYNIGGGRQNNCSILEAVALCEEISGKKMKIIYEPQARSGDHIWYISGMDKFAGHYPQWQQTIDIRGILEDIYNGVTSRREQL